MFFYDIVINLLTCDIILKKATLFDKITAKLLFFEAIFFSSNRNNRPNNFKVRGLPLKPFLLYYLFKYINFKLIYICSIPINKT